MKENRLVELQRRVVLLDRVLGLFIQMTFRQRVRWVLFGTLPWQKKRKETV